jgi:hypothetical protein
VGHDLGVVHTGANQHRRHIRLGAEIAELSDHEYAVWLLPHGVGDKNRPTLGTLVEQAGEIGMTSAQATDVIERFVREGLLVVAEPDGDRMVEFARGHRLVPLVVGLGVEEEAPRMRVVGAWGRPVARVSVAMFDVLMWAQLRPDLWSGCCDAAEVAVQAGVTAEEEIEPRRVLAGVLGRVHGLLGVRAAYFDRRAS